MFSLDNEYHAGWEHHYVLVSLSTRDGTYAFLLDHMSQSEFFERYVQAGYRFIMRMEVPMFLEEEAFETLKDQLLDSGRVWEGE